VRGRTRQAVTAIATALLFATPAHADITKEECIDANTRGQDLVHDGKLRAAHAILQSCTAPSCPAIIRGDCTRRLDELQKLEPSIVFEAKDGVGNDLAAVHVTVDGAPLSETLDGTPLRVDPGEHVFVFTVAGRPAVTRKLVLAERDQSRREVIVVPALADAIAVVVTPPEAQAEAPQPKHSGLSKRRELAIVTAGVGVLALGVGGVFGILTGSAWSDQQADCSAGNCKHHAQALSDHSTLETDSVVSTTAFIAGGVLVAAGAALFFTDGPRASSGATGLLIVPAVSPEGSGLLLRGSF